MEAKEVIMDSTSLDMILRSLPLLLKGAALSLQIFAIATPLSFVLGTIMGSLTCRRLRSRWIASAIEGITFVLRAVSFYVQLLIAYFVLPDLLGIELEAFTAPKMLLNS